MATWTHAQAAVAEPAVQRRRAGARPAGRNRRRAQTRARARAGVLWIVVSGILLAGVVFVNVAVLRLNLSLDSANAQRAKLRAQTAALQQQLSAELASPRIQLRAHNLGLVAATQIEYVDLHNR